MNLKDALNKALRTTKQYVDKTIEENTFSGDYNDLTNRPCYMANETELFRISLADLKSNIETAIANKVNYFMINMDLFPVNMDSYYYLSFNGQELLPNYKDEYPELYFYINNSDDDTIHRNYISFYGKNSWVDNDWATDETKTLVEVIFTKRRTNEGTVGYDDIKNEILNYYTDDIVLIEREKVTLSNHLLDKDLKIENSLSMLREGDIGVHSVSLGNGCMATGADSFAMGSGNIASGASSSALGVKTKATAWASHAEGNVTTAGGDLAHAEGYATTANGMSSHAEGSNTIASSMHQHVQGRFNIEDAGNNYAHIVGNGTYYDKRSNAHTLDWNGNAWFQGNVSIDGTPTSDNDLTTKKYVDKNNSKYLDCQVENIVINKLHARNLKMRECSCFYEWDRESGKNSSDLIMEVLDPSSNYYYHDLFLKSDTFKNSITKPSIYDKDIESYFAIVLNDSYLTLNKLCDCEYYGLNSFGYRQGSAAIKNTKDSTVESAFCYYPFSPTVPIDTGYQNFSSNTYDPDNNTLHIATTCKKDSQINNIKIYKVNVFKMINTSFDYTKDIMNFIKDEYGSEYELKFSMVAKVNDRDQNTDNYNDNRYGALMYFQKNTSCIVDWGDGTIEKFKDIKKIDHPYKAGYYHVNIYSKNYLPIHTIDSFYDIQINLLDTSEHTSIVNLFYNNATDSLGENQITLNCAVDFSKAQNCSSAFTSITNLNPNVFANATNINNLNNAFCGNSWLTEIPSTLNTSKVTDFYCAFQSMQGVTHIPTLNLSSASRFDAVFFDSCRIKTMDELDFGQGTFTEVDCCFAACHSLIEAKLKNTGRITNFCECFLDCINLEKVSELDISSIDMTEEERWIGDDGLTVHGLNSMFHNCYKLKDVKLVGETTADKINAFINELPTNPVEGITRTLDISACTNKNGVTATADTWTIVK
jgi:hypothetical protein